MKLAKLKILVETRYPNFDLLQPIVVLFNPNRIEISKTGWQTDSAGNPIPADQPATLNIELFFDTSLPDPGLGGTRMALSAALIGRTSLLPGLGLPSDVRQYTQPIYHLTEINGSLNRPPICRLVWGRKGGVLFQGVLRQVTKSFTRFLADGTPIRATLGCAFEEWQPAQSRQKGQNPVDDPTRLVKQGETLSSIAAEEYNDPNLWRVIAEANQIDNPRQLKPGFPLTVPPLRPNSVTQRR